MLLRLIADTPGFLLAFVGTHGAWVYGLLFSVIFAEVRGCDREVQWGMRPRIIGCCSGDVVMFFRLHAAF